MILPIFRPEAAADVEEAFRWYEARSPGLGDEFLAAMRVAVEAVLQNPERYPVIHRKTRRLLLKRFPYNLYYRIVDDFHHPTVDLEVVGSALDAWGFTIPFLHPVRNFPLTTSVSRSYTHSYWMSGISGST